MTSQRSRNSTETVAAMCATAEELEATEAILHRSAERSPRDDTTRRLHSLGDAVTAEAKRIERSAQDLADS